MCNEVWHLDGGGKRLTRVAAEQLDLVLAWDQAAIELPEHLLAVLRKIGPMPPDVYWSGTERRVTPCTIETLSGERFDKRWSASNEMHRSEIIWLSDSAARSCGSARASSPFACLFAMPAAAPRKCARVSNRR